MIDEHNVVAVSRFDGDAYKSSQAAELTVPKIRSPVIFMRSSD
jgi:hypothetical protein